MRSPATRDRVPVHHVLRLGRDAARYGSRSVRAKVEPEWIAKAAVFARERGVMKDLPAFLAAVLSMRSADLLRKVFPRVIDSPKMLRNFVQIVRSGAVARKSLGTVPKGLVLRWLEERSDEADLQRLGGECPVAGRHLEDGPPEAGHEDPRGPLPLAAGQGRVAGDLPPAVRPSSGTRPTRRTVQVPDVPFQMLTALPLGKDEWAEIARRAPWQMTRMNLNTFQRHGVFEVPGLTEIVAERLRNPELIAKARVLPYQLLMAFTPRRRTSGLPAQRSARRCRTPWSIDPERAGGRGQGVGVPGCLGLDALAGDRVRKGATSAVRCIDVAALVAAAILRKNPDAEVLPFSRTWSGQPEPARLGDDQRAEAGEPAGGRHQLLGAAGGT